jgi:hypothetical protein
MRMRAPNGGCGVGKREREGWETATAQCCLAPSGGASTWTSHRLARRVCFWIKTEEGKGA